MDMVKNMLGMIDEMRYLPGIIFSVDSCLFTTGVDATYRAIIPSFLSFFNVPGRIEVLQK